MNSSGHNWQRRLFLRLSRVIPYLRASSAANDMTRYSKLRILFPLLTFRLLVAKTHTLRRSWRPTPGINVDPDVARRGRNFGLYARVGV